MSCQSCPIRNAVCSDAVRLGLIPDHLHLHLQLHYVQRSTSLSPNLRPYRILPYPRPKNAAGVVVYTVEARVLLGCLFG